MRLSLMKMPELTAGLPTSGQFRLCVIREKGCYMGDYIQDEKGKLKEIRFDKVKES